MRELTASAALPSGAIGAATAPDVYSLDADGFCLPVGDVPAGAEEDAREGAASCPEQAIAVTG